MALTNPWTNPLRRSYQAIKDDMIEALKNIRGKNGNQVVQITDLSEGNIFVIIISLFAAIAENLHYYIDNMARECFLGTARRYSSVQKQGLLVDYLPQGANAATVDVVLTRPLSGIVESGALITIPKGTEFLDSSGTHWESIKDVIWDSNQLNCTVPLIQHELYNSSLVGTYIESADTPIYLDQDLGGKLIENSTVSATIGRYTWTKVETFAYSKPTDHHFRVVVDENDQPMMVFGDGRFGSKLTVGSRITDLKFYVTLGSNGNVNKDAITTVPSIIAQSVEGATCNNPYPSGDGMDYEDIETLRNHISLHARTMRVAITKQDFIDCAKLVPGVKDCAVDYICGKRMDLYISPSNRDENGGLASSTLCDSVKSYLEQRCPMTTWLNVLPAGIARIHLSIDVTGKKSYRYNEIQEQILRALYNQYSFSNAVIGGKVRISDIYALIDNLESVDYLYIKKFFVGPWPKIIYGNSQLNLRLNNIAKASGSMTYIISFSSNNQFSIYSTEGGFVMNGATVGNVQVEDQKNGFIFSITIAGTYEQGSKYSFTISEPNHDYEEPGFNQVVFDSSELLTLTINETV